MAGPFSDIFNRFASHLQAHPEHTLLLTMDDLEGFRCQRGGLCCRNPWIVNLDQDYYDTWHERLKALVGWTEPVLVLQTDDRLKTDAVAYIAKQKGTNLCAFQSPDRGCMIHSQLGEAALPQTCQRYPRDRAFVGSRYANDTLTSACEHAASQLDKQADLTFEMLPVAEDQFDAGVPLRFGLEHNMTLLDLLPLLGRILDRVMHPEYPLQLNMIEVANLLGPLPESSALVWPPTPEHQRGAILHFLKYSPFDDNLNEFIARGQRLEIPLPQLDLRSQQRLERFQRQYLLRRLINLDPLSRGRLSLHQYLWLLGFGLLAQNLLLAYRLRQGVREVNLRDLVAVVTEWEMMGLQHPSWIYKIQLAGRDDLSCRQDLIATCGATLA